MPPIFASKDNPCRASKAPTLLRCSLRVALVDEGLIVDGDNIAAHTGRGLHKGAETFHRDGKRRSFEKAWKGVQASRHEYDLADFAKVEKMLRGYCRDPRNGITPLLIEQEVTIELDPWPTDKTKEKIVFLGHLDQVREMEGELAVVDIKATTKGGIAAINSYAAQLVLYALGASKLLEKPVSPGYILRASSYLTQKNESVESPDDVFFRCPFSLSDAGGMLDELRREVARVRSRELGPRPSEDCTYCPAGNLGYCSSLLTLSKSRRNRK